MVIGDSEVSTPWDSFFFQLLKLELNNIFSTGLYFLYLGWRHNVEQAESDEMKPET